MINVNDINFTINRIRAIKDPHLGVEISDNDTSRLRRLVDRYLHKKQGQRELLKGAA